MQARTILSGCVFSILLLCSFFAAKASHVVGGQITYTCLGNNVYRVRVDLFQDCLTGDASAIRQDSTAYLGFFLGDGTVYGRPDTAMRATSKTRVVPELPVSCIDNFPQTCLDQVTYIKDYVLPPNPKGYRIIYQRCCRNNTVQNIQNPGRTGASYYCDIPPSTVSCNNSAIFKSSPPQIICVNNPLKYDHSATDPDGDSLSYEFCTAYAGGTDTDAKPVPDDAQLVAVNYIPGYTATRPMASSPRIQIDPKSGIITATPTIEGRFVVTVCCHEWRNGIMINTVIREFQFVVTNCSKKVVANIPQYSNEFNTYIVECDDYNVHFVNKSTGGDNYDWSFGTGATSTEFEPTYTYPDTGIYIVKLIVNKGTPCPDSIERIVKVFPSYKADFDNSGLPCPHSPIQFADRSVATYNPIIEWNWNFGDNGTSTEQNPVHIFDNGGNYSVSLESASIKGCRDTIVKTVTVDNFYPFAGNDTIIVKGERINFNATGGDNYEWTPGEGLSFPSTANPSGYYPDTGRFAYNVHISTVSGCEADDSIKVWVVAQSSLFVPSAFTPNGDGRNDFLKPLGVGYANVRFFRVFNRFGELVYNGENFKEGWDGTYKGQMADVGVYFWVLGVVNRFGANEMIKGDATLMR